MQMKIFIFETENVFTGNFTFYPFDELELTHPGENQS